MNKSIRKRFQFRNRSFFLPDNLCEQVTISAHSLRGFRRKPLSPASSYMCVFSVDSL